MSSGICFRCQSSEEPETTCSPCLACLFPLSHFPSLLSPLSRSSRCLSSYLRALFRSLFFLLLNFVLFFICSLILLSHIPSLFPLSLVPFSFFLLTSVSSALSLHSFFFSCLSLFFLLSFPLTSFPSLLSPLSHFLFTCLYFFPLTRVFFFSLFLFSSLLFPLFFSFSCTCSFHLPFLTFLFYLVLF